MVAFKFGFLTTSLLIFVGAVTCTRPDPYINYTTVTGFFLQDDPTTNPSTFDYTAYNWGLINRTYPTDTERTAKKNLTQWQRFERYVKHINRESPRHTEYKVLFMGRHGEGYHNAAESFFGTPAWNCYYAELNGNATAEWADAKLTANGITQARIANNFWRHSIAVQKIPTPESYYSSPLWRCLDTARITFGDLDLKGRSKFRPVIKEFLREGITPNTCNRRRSKTTLQKNFPEFRIERGFTEKDELWTYIFAETGTGQAARSKALLDDVFSNDDNTWLSVSSHSGEIASLLGVLGHRAFRLSTGQVIPVLVKAETIRSPDAASTTTTAPARTTTLYCTESPVTSIAGTGCVCQNGASPTVTPLVPSGQYLDRRR